MAYCRNCGTEVSETQTVCPNCGMIQPDSQNYTPAPVQIDNGGFGWGLLGCCIPIVGLVLWLVWKDTKPKTAKAVGMGALVSAGLSVLYYIFIFIIGIGAALL